MGSWNETCAVSNLPVRHKERIVIMPLCATAQAGPKATEIDKYWQPFALPIRCAYNDYGGVEGIEEDDSGQFNSIELLYDENNKPLNFTKEGFQDQLNEFLLNHDDYEAQEFVGSFSKKFDFMLVKEDLFDFLTGRVAERTAYGTDRDMKAVTSEALDGKAKRLFKEKMDEAIKSIQNATIYKNVDAKEVANAIYGENAAREALSETFGKCRFFGQMFSPILLYKHNKPCENRLKERFVELQLFAFALNLLRKGWLCQTSGHGSQDYELRLHKELAGKIQDIVLAAEESYCMEQNESCNESCDGCKKKITPEVDMYCQWLLS